MTKLAKAIAEGLLKNTTLKNLSLSENPINDDGLKYLRRGIERKKTLQELNLLRLRSTYEYKSIPGHDKPVQFYRLTRNAIGNFKYACSRYGCYTDIAVDNGYNNPNHVENANISQWVNWVSTADLLAYDNTLFSPKKTNANQPQHSHHHDNNDKKTDKKDDSHTPPPEHSMQ